MAVAEFVVKANTPGQKSAGAESSSKNDQKNKVHDFAPRMTPELLMSICKERHMWTQPHLNTQLFLNYKGFMCIEGLEDYVKVRSLHLDNNNIGKIEGLDRMSDLRTLHLGGNRIMEIENLDANTELRNLDLQGNGIRHISGLQNLTKLETINLAANNLECLDGLLGLKEAPALLNIDVSQNSIETTDGIVEFWAELKQVRVLRYHGNPGIRSIQHYRKRLINDMPQLNYLDERPVFPVERRSCAAWAEGGMSAMHQAKKDFTRERHAECRVEESRKEMLTQRRKMAIERLDREAREREEQERKAEADKAKPADSARGAAQEGDQGALDDYAKSWRTQVSLYGTDGVRAKVAKESGAGQQAAAAAAAQLQSESAPAARKHKPDFDFVPPTRGAGGADNPLAPSTRPISALRSERAVSSRAFDAAAFKARSGDDHKVDSADRQFAVLGNDDWTLPASAQSSNSTREEQVMPQMWADRAAYAAEQEMAIMDQNLAISAAMSKDKAMESRASIQRSDDLQVLD
mmetsp:Transcript_98741/g.171076  ORF Transcript_98741/g.171076 Transcript_98741/m.171076 type:complete len:520 (-) Transcript_98741:133-1692(-)